jgi:hypothetical protein
MPNHGERIGEIKRNLNFIGTSAQTCLTIVPDDRTAACTADVR